jgi:hypothetical protein
MTNSETQAVYYELVVEATCQTTEIWLGDDYGHFVQKGSGVLETSLLPGKYTVEFGLGSPCYPISLTGPSRYTQLQLEAEPSCPRHVPKC